MVWRSYHVIGRIEGFMWCRIKPILQVIILATAMLLSILHSSVLENTTKCPRTFNLVHITIPNCNWVTRILAHHLVEISNPVMKKIPNNCMFCCFFSVPHSTKRKLGRGAKSCKYGCVLRHTNPLSSKLRCPYCTWKWKSWNEGVRATPDESLTVLNLSDGEPAKIPIYRYEFPS